MRISDWSSDVCSSDLEEGVGFRIVELLGLQNTRARRKKRRAYGGNYSRTIRARKFEIIFFRHTIFLSLLCIGPSVWRLSSVLIGRQSHSRQDAGQYVRWLGNFHVTRSE